MIQEITLTKRVQTPTPPNEWCYQDQGEDFRYFTKRVLLGKNEQPWAECTDEEKVQWEEAHTNQPAESINLYPTPPAEWLWRDHADDVKREFHPSVTIPSQDEPLWHECTESARLAYEAEWAATHPEEGDAAVVEPNGDMPAEALRPTEVAADAATTPVAEEGLGV